MASSVDDMIKLLARAEDVTKPVTKATDATKVPDGMDAFLRLIPPPRESVPKPVDLRVDNLRVIEEDKELGFRKVGYDEFNAIDINVTDDAHQIHTAFLLGGSGSEAKQGFKGKGLGIEMYMKAIDDALAEGKVFKSDTIVSSDAQRVWEALERRGYILERNPKAEQILDMNHNLELETLHIPDEEPGDAVFTIVGKQQQVEE